MDILRQPIPRQPQGQTKPQAASHAWKVASIKHDKPLWAPPYHTRLIPR